jgi:hypothetical protein
MGSNDLNQCWVVALLLQINQRLFGNSIYAWGEGWELITT